MSADQTLTGATSDTRPAHTAPRAHRYAGKRAVLATKHDKLALIAPALLDRVELIVDDVAVDTDRFGTFTGDIARTGSPWDTAVSKARLGMRVAAVPIGLASEGSIGPHPAVPFVIASVELVVVVDDELGIVVGEADTGFDIVTVAADVAVGDDIDDLLRRGRFPDHAMTVRPAAGPTRPIYKGIHTRRELNQALRSCASASSDECAHLETDLRAHHCPSRRPIIARAAERLAARLAACCPECNVPGWGVIRLEFGVPCESCGRSVEMPRADVMGCAACSATQTVAREQAFADPGRCEWCNP